MPLVSEVCPVGEKFELVGVIASDNEATVVIGLNSHEKTRRVPGGSV